MNYCIRINSGSSIPEFGPPSLFDIVKINGTASWMSIGQFRAF